MKVRMEGVSFTKASRKGLRLGLDKIDFVLRGGDRTALIAVHGGDSGIVFDLLAGAMEPDSGHIYREGLVSWSLPRAKFVSPLITGTAAARFVARLHGVNSDKYIRRILSLTEDKKYLDVKLRQWPNSAKSEFLAAMGICLDFDFYLVDGAPTGTRSFLRRWNETLKNLPSDKGLLLGAYKPEEVLDICDQAYIVDGNQLLYFPKIAGAVKFCSKLSSTEFSRRARKETAADGAEEEADDDVF